MKRLFVIPVMLVVAVSFLFGGWGPHVQITVDNIFSNGYANATNGEYVYVNYSDNSAGNLELYTQRSTDYGATWESKVRQTSNSAVTYEGMICARDSFVHIVFPDYRFGSGWENGELLYIRSTDAGNTWAAEERITFATSTSGCGDMQFTGSNIYISFRDWRDGGGYPRLYWMSSDDYGVSWNSDEQLDDAEVWDSNVAADGSIVHLVWGRRYALTTEVIYMKSTNGGGNWSSDVMLSTAGGSSSGSPRVTMHGDTVMVFWIEGFDIFCRRSFDGGSSFEAEMNITNSAEWENGLDVGFDGTGKIHMVTRELYMSTRYENLYSYSIDCGMTWLGDTAITDEAGTTYSGHLTVESNGSLHLTWRDDRDGDIEVFYCGFPSSASSHPPMSPYIYAEKFKDGNKYKVKVYWDAVDQDTLGNPVDIDHYDIYAGSVPDFIPGSGNHLSAETDTFYIESKVPLVNKYYLVIAETSTGLTSQKSNMGYVQWKSIVENPSSTDKNWVAFPWHKKYVNVSDYCDEEAASGTPFEQVTNLRNDQLYESWTWDDVFSVWDGTDFLFETGHGYEMVAVMDEVIPLIGSNNPDGEIAFNENPSATDKNWISIPYNGDYANVSDVTTDFSPSGDPLIQLSNLRDDQYYESYTWDDVFLMWIGTDFALVRGRAIEAIATADALWDPIEYTNVAKDGIADREKVVHSGVTVYTGSVVRKAVSREVGVSHLVRYYIDGRLEDVQFRVYRSHIPEDILTERLVGSYVVSDGRKTGIGCNVGNFIIPWKADEEMVLEISGMKGGIPYRAMVSFVLDGSVDIQDLGEYEVAGNSGAMGNIVGSPSVYSFRCYPNPVIDKAFISYALPRSSRVVIKVFDIAGRQVAMLRNGYLEPGYHTVRLDSRSLGAGIYYIRMQAETFTGTQKLIIMK